MKTKTLDVMSDLSRAKIVSTFLAELRRLHEAKFTGSVSLRIRLHEGGITGAWLGLEHGIALQCTDRNYEQGSAK